MMKHHLTFHSRTTRIIPLFNLNFCHSFTSLVSFVPPRVPTVLVNFTSTREVGGKGVVLRVRPFTPVSVSPVPPHVPSSFLDIKHIFRQSLGKVYRSNMTRGHMRRNPEKRDRLFKSPLFLTSTFPFLVKFRAFHFNTSFYSGKIRIH